MSHRWSRPQKDRIHNSRVNSAELLACAFQTATDPPSVFVCTSVSGLYGNCGDQVLTEGSEARNHFRSDSTFVWGRTTDDIASAGVQVCNVIWPDSRTVRRRPRQTVAHIPTRFWRPPVFRSTIYQLDFPSRHGASDRAHSETRFDVRTSDRFIAQPRDQCGVYINPRQSRQKALYFSSS